MQPAALHPGAAVTLSRTADGAIVARKIADDAGAYDFGRFRPGEFSVKVNASDVDADGVSRLYEEVTKVVSLVDKDLATPDPVAAAAAAAADAEA